jgi:hypothetical protein
MPIKPKEVEHTFLVRTLEGWKPIKEVPIADFGDITEYRLSETEPMSLAEESYSISIKLDAYGRLWAWFVDWQIMRDIPKISRK